MWCMGSMEKVIQTIKEYTLLQGWPYSMEDSMYSQPTSTQPRTDMPRPNTIHKPMNIMYRTAQPAKASGQMLPTNTVQQWKQK